MKFTLLLLSLSIFSPSLLATHSYAASFDGKAFKNTEKMDFSDSSDTEIAAYYSNTTGKTGDELKERLYDIISYDNYFVTYEKAWSWYKITDRNWALSQSISPDNYTFSSDNKDNHYLYLMYFEDSANNDKKKAVNQSINSFNVDKNVTGIDWAAQKRNSANLGVDREHVWAKNHGFKVKDGNKDVLNPGAPTDLHHLVAADHMTNSQAHNDYYYGNVNHANATKMYCYYADGSKAVSGWREKVGDDYVYEPTDEWKGDVARCLFYMATRYGKKEIMNTQEEPYLVLSDDPIYQDDNQLFHGVHRNLQDFLKWNELDPVSTYETHRNNLIYKNVQKNRNPFVDHPEWARAVFDPESLQKDDFSKLKESYHLHCEDEFALDIQIARPNEVTYEISDDSLFTLKEDLKTIQVNKEGKEGKATLTYHYYEGGVPTSKTTEITIKKKAQVTPSIPSITIKEGEETSLSFESENLFEEEKIKLTSTDENILKITEDNKLQALSYGTCEVQFYLENTQENTSTLLLSLPVTIQEVTNLSKLKEKYQLHCGEEEKLEIHIASDVTYEINNTDLITLSADKKTIVANNRGKEGKATLTYHYKDNDNQEKSVTTQVEVKSAVSVTSLYDVALKMTVGMNYLLQYTVDGNCFENESVILRSSDEKVATITSEGYVKAVGEGKCIIQIVLTNSEKGDKVLSEIEVSVEPDKKMLYIIIIVVAAVLLIAIILVFVFLIRNANKKEAKKKMEDYIQTAKKIYKKTSKKNTKKKK